MKAYLTRRYMISASHRLHAPTLSEQQNVEIYGKCNNPHGHGHNYAIEVTVSGPVNEETGMVCDLVDLDTIVQREVVEKFDHQNLNTLTEFADLVPTTENLAQAVYQKLKQNFKVAHLEKVRIQETRMNSFEYAGDLEPRR